MGSLYMYSTPYLAIWELKNAVDKKEFERTSEYIDFVDLKVNLKKQLNEAVLKKAQKKIIKTPFGDLSMIVVNPVLKAIVTSTVEATISPYGLKTLLEQGELTRVSQPKQRKANTGKKTSSRKMNLYYKNINTFVIESDMQEKDETLKVFWRRNGIANWKINNIELPLESINLIP